MPRNDKQQIKPTEIRVSDQLPEFENLVEVFALLIKVDERTKKADV